MLVIAAEALHFFVLTNFSAVRWPIYAKMWNWVSSKVTAEWIIVNCDELLPSGLLKQTGGVEELFILIIAAAFCTTSSNHASDKTVCCREEVNWTAAISDERWLHAKRLQHLHLFANQPTPMQSAHSQKQKITRLLNLNLGGRKQKKVKWWPKQDKCWEIQVSLENKSRDFSPNFCFLSIIAIDPHARFSTKSDNLVNVLLWWLT